MVDDGIREDTCQHLRENFDLLNPHQVENPYHLFKSSREQCPVFYSEQAGAWIVTRFDDIVQIAHDTERFSSAYANKTTQPIPEAVKGTNTLVHWDVPGLVDNDPPRHTRVRKLANQAFTPPRVRAMEPSIRKRAEELVQRMLPQGRGDLQQEFGIPLPLLTILGILGLPVEDAKQIRRWSLDYNNERAANLSLNERLEYTHGRSALRLYLASQVEERRARPTDDAISHLVQAEVDGEKLDTWEIVTVLQSLVHAGHETTVGLIGTLVYYLLADRHLWEEVLVQPELRPAAVEEALRREGSVNGMFRVTVEDVEVGGVAIPKGSFVQPMFSSGSHDEKYFTDPMTFDIHRETPHEHLAFGKGRHYCLGAPLARAEGRVALDVLSEMMPKLRLAAGAEQNIRFLHSTQFRARVALPVEWD